jgi:hypothetical protein
MSSTISRTTWTDDTGTPASPAGDGTIINNAQLQLIYDSIDGLFTGELITGRLAAESHSSGIAIKADVANSGGGVIVRVRNTQAGTAANAEVRIGNDGAQDAGRIIFCSTTFTTAGHVIQDGMTMISTRAGGLHLACSHASGLVTLRSKSGYSVVSPTLLTGNQTDYNLGGTDAGIYLVTSNAAVQIDGITGGVTGRCLIFVNANAIGGSVITLGFNTGSAGNRMMMAAAGNRGMNPQSWAVLLYDGTNWIVGANP